jgi:hypothetical protein
MIKSILIRLCATLLVVTGLSYIASLYSAVAVPKLAIEQVNNPDAYIAAQQAAQKLEFLGSVSWLIVIFTLVFWTFLPVFRKVSPDGKLAS